MFKFGSSIVLSLALIGHLKCQSKLHVEVLYESLCPDSLSFITQQLHPVFKELAPYVDLKLTPFGKSASVPNGVDFVCQHGPRECQGNKLQSCVLQAVQDQTVQVEYVNCFMQTFKKGQNDEHEFGQTCAEAAGVNFNDVAECYGSAVGTQLQLLAEQNTARILPTFVPTILYNGVFNQKLQDDSLVDFRRVACSLIKENHPEACQGSSIIRL